MVKPADAIEACRLQTEPDRKGHRGLVYRPGRATRWISSMSVGWVAPQPIPHSSIFSILAEDRLVGLSGRCFCTGLEGEPGELAVAPVGDSGLSPKLVRLADDAEHEERDAQEVAAP